MSLINSNMPKENYKVLIPIGGAVIFAGIAGYLYYKLLKKDEEMDDLVKDSLPFITFTTVEVKIPANVIGAVIGRQGANVKKLQETTSTIINFRDEENGEKTCVIKGKLEKVEKAKEMLLNVIKDIPDIETEELQLPNKLIGRIIGRNGETIQSIQRISGAKIKICDHAPANSLSEGPEDKRKIVIRGTKEQITAAKLKILEKADEEEKLQADIKTSASHISKRSKGSSHQNGEVVNSEKPSIFTEELPRCLMSSTTYNEAYISAVATGAHFWVQVVGPKTVQLDKLVSEMSDYYDQAENREFHTVNDLEPNKIVAAKFNDGQWYRGRICKDYRDEQEKIPVYFVDFGDTDNVDRKDICLLRTDFLRLGFQAIECYLSGIDLESAKNEDAADTFETLSYASQWKPLMVRVMGYRREGNDTIPFLKVIDTNGSEDVDIAEELVRRGLVKRLETNGSPPGSSKMDEPEEAAN